MPLAQRVTLGLATLAALAACGTTVPLADRPSGLTADLGDGLTAAPPGSSGAAAPERPGAVAAPGTSAARPGRTAGSLPPVAARVPTGPAPVVPEGAPVKVGFFVSEDVGKALAAFGLNGLSSGDGRRQVAAATALVNARGGLDGHPVVPVVYQASATTNESQQSSEQQAACETFFTDNTVVAVVSVLPTDVISACSLKHRVPLSVSSISTLSRAQLSRFPNVALPNQVERDHGVDVIVRSLARAGYFTPTSVTDKVRIGLVTNDAPGFERVPAETAAALRREGLELDGHVTMSTADRASAEASAGVLRFQSRGINRVLSIDDHGGAMTFFLLAASAQGYYPRLGLSSYSIPQVAADVLPARQFQDAVGVGWLPTFDVGLADANRTLSPPAKACMTAMGKAGEDVGSSGSRGIALGVCDSVLALQAAVRGRGLGLSGYLDGLRALGTSYVSTLTFSTDFRARRAGADRVRIMGYAADCRCFHYRGAAFRP